MKKEKRHRPFKSLSQAWLLPLMLVAACGGGGGGGDVTATLPSQDTSNAAAAATPVTDAAQAASASPEANVADGDHLDPFLNADAVDVAQINDDQAQARIASGELPADAGGAHGAVASSSDAVVSQDADGVTAIAADDALTLTTKAPLVATISGGYGYNSAQAARLYGPGQFVMDGLWNLNAQRARGSDTITSMRFRAPFSGNLSSVRLYWSDGSGYAGGNGGDIALRVLPDDGSARNLPDWGAAPLATGRRLPGSMSMRNGRYSTISHRFAADTLSSSRPLEAGKLYHLIAINNASDPATNWSSMNMAWSLNANGQPSRWISLRDYSVLQGRRSAGSTARPTWTDWTVDGVGGARVVPIMQLTMSDGRSFGQTNMETGNVDSGRVWKNGSGSPIRERYVPTQSRAISGLSLQTARVSGSGGLRWQILQGTRELASGTIWQGSNNYRVDYSLGGTGVLTWYDVALPSRVNLAAGQPYDVVFTPQSSSVWAFADQRNGSAYGFGSPPAFTQSQAQTYTGGRWLNANHWSKNSSANGSNWRVVLHVAD